MASARIVSRSDGYCALTTGFSKGADYPDPACVRCFTNGNCGTNQCCDKSFVDPANYACIDGARAPDDSDTCYHEKNDAGALNAPLYPPLIQAVGTTEYKSWMPVTHVQSAVINGRVYRACCNGRCIWTDQDAYLCATGTYGWGPRHDYFECSIAGLAPGCFTKWADLSHSWFVYGSYDDSRCDWCNQGQPCAATDSDGKYSELDYNCEDAEYGCVSVGQECVSGDPRPWTKNPAAFGPSP